MKSEILAPVGGKQQLLAAVRCGADAVYLGTKGFNARRNAENFENDALIDTVRFCHRHGVKVYVTVNTLITDDEMEALEETAYEVAASGADAVIVQDPAVMELFLKRYPTLPVHASTQCVVTNTDGVRFLEDLGVSRVVLARELSLKEIEKIRRETTADLEAFVHGALCMSVSGSCYLSSVIGGRSGNRGLCAQPCRLNFRCFQSDYALSLKDMSHIRQIPQLAQAGICSFKIEGRMKRPEYVAAAVTACRLARDGKAYDEAQLRAVFSRSGFTNGYLAGKRDSDMFGRRSKEDVVAAEEVFRSLQRLYDRETPLLPVKMTLGIQGGAPSLLTAVCNEKAVQVNGPHGIPAEQHPTDAEYAAKFLKKTGGTPFFVSEMQVNNDGSFMLPPSELNGMRRQALDALSDALGAVHAHPQTDFSFVPEPYSPPDRTALWGRFSDVSQLWENISLDRIILPYSCVLDDPALAEKYAGRLIAEPPAVLFPENEDEIRQAFKKLLHLGVKDIWAENIYALRLGNELGLNVYGGAGLNIMNSHSLQKYADWGLSAATVSFELTMNRIGKLGSTLPRGYIAYGRLPVMRMRNCPAKAAAGCAACGTHAQLTDRTGAKFPLVCENRRFVTLLNSVPLHLGGKYQCPADFKLLYFTVETPEECRQIADEIAGNRASDGPRTGGLYYRAVK